jgi:hypothetical protein
MLASSRLPIHPSTLTRSLRWPRRHCMRTFRGAFLACQSLLRQLICLRGHDRWRFLMFKERYIRWLRHFFSCSMRSFWSTRMTIVTIIALAVVATDPPCLKTFTILFLAFWVLTTAPLWKMCKNVCLSNAYNVYWPSMFSHDLGASSNSSSRLLASECHTQLSVLGCVHTVSTAALQWVTSHPILQTITIALSTSIVMAITLYLTFFSWSESNQHGCSRHSWCLSILGDQPCILSDEKCLRRGLACALTPNTHPLTLLINRLFN